MVYVLAGLLGSFIQIAVIAGIVVLIVRAVSNKDKASTQTAAVTMRRVFVYGIMLVMLIFVAIGIAGLIDAALPSSDVLVDDNSAAARSIAFVVVGLPIYIGLAVFTNRRLRDDRRERRSWAWLAYVTIALVASLITWMALLNSALVSIVAGRGIERTATINALVWLVVWVGHWVAVQRYVPRFPALGMLAGSAVGLVWSFVGIAVTSGVALSTIYDSLVRDALIGREPKDILSAGVAIVIGVPVWWWYWFRAERHDEQTPLWHAYVLLLGVLGGAVTAIVGAGTALFTVITWIISSPDTSAASHFDVIPGAVAAIGVGLGMWWYHGDVVGRRGTRDRIEIDRIYDYLLSAAGLVVTASGMSALIAVVLTSAFSTTVVGSGERETVATAITLLVVGVPIWWRYWSLIQRNRSTDPVTEVQSITRRIYIIGIFGIASVVAIISLMILAFVVFEDLLDGTLGSATITDTAVPIALILTAGTASLYHLAVLRADRAVELPEEAAVAPEDHPEPARVLPMRVTRGNLEATLEGVAADRVMVTRTDDGFLIDLDDETRGEP